MADAIRNVGTSTTGLKVVSRLTSPAGVSDTETSLVTINDAAVLKELQNNGIPVHRVRGDGRLWLRVLPSSPTSPTVGDVWLENDISLGTVLRVRTIGGTQTLFADGTGGLQITAASALLQGHAVRPTGSGLVYAAAVVDGSSQYRAVGLVAEDTLISTSATVISSGSHLTLTDWSLLTGAAPLTVGAVYWLSSTPGRYTTTPNAAVAARVGRAVTTTTMLVDVGFAVVS